MTRECEVAVVGGGPAGLTAAIALASAGVETALIAKAPPSDNRTTALLSGSVAALDALGVWPLCSAEAAPLTAIRIIDDTSRLFRAPEVTFEAAEIGLDAFGHNVENRHLIAALDRRAADLKDLQRVAAKVGSIEPAADRVTVRLDDGGTLDARLVVGADGRKSLCRQAVSIETRRHEYLQAALTLNLAHTRPHNSTSTEFHTETGPFTLVPLPGLRSSLVCVLDRDGTESLGALDASALSAEIERRSHSILGKVSVEGGRGLFPLAIETAQTFGRERIALVGEAAHVIPPIGAQGLNLALRDVATLAQCIGMARASGQDVGAPETLQRYHYARVGDVVSRTVSVDLLNRSLIHDFLPAQAARGLGLHLLANLGPLRRLVMRSGLNSPGPVPPLMQPMSGHKS